MPSITPTRFLFAAVLGAALLAAPGRARADEPPAPEPADVEATRQMLDALREQQAETMRRLERMVAEVQAARTQHAGPERMRALEEQVAVLRQDAEALEKAIADLDEASALLRGRVIELTGPEGSTHRVVRLRLLHGGDADEDGHVVLVEPEEVEEHPVQTEPADEVVRLYDVRDLLGEARALLGDAASDEHLQAFVEMLRMAAPGLTDCHLREGVLVVRGGERAQQRMAGAIEALRRVHGAVAGTEAVDLLGPLVTTGPGTVRVIPPIRVTGPGTVRVIPPIRVTGQEPGCDDDCDGDQQARDEMNQLERRLAEMRQAMHHLEAAGLREQMAQVKAQMERLQRQMAERQAAMEAARAARDRAMAAEREAAAEAARLAMRDAQRAAGGTGGGAGGPAAIERLARALRETREQVEALRKEVAELRELVQAARAPRRAR